MISTLNFDSQAKVYRTSVPLCCCYVQGKQRGSLYCTQAR